MSGTAQVTDEIKALEQEIHAKHKELDALRLQQAPEPVADFVLQDGGGDVSLSELFGEKRDLLGRGEGVWYMTAGRASGVGVPWSDKSWFEELMDYDGDGVPEYQTQVTGTRRPGYLRITADGTRCLQIDYVRTSLNNPALNGTTLLSFTIEQGP